MSRKQKATLVPELDQIVQPAPELAIIKLGFGGRVLDSELKRQMEAGLVDQYGQLMIEGKLLMPNMLFALPRTEALQRAMEAGWILDQGVSIPSGWITTKDGRIVRP